MELNILDGREEELIELLTKQYENFMTPTMLQKGTNGIKSLITNITPAPLKDIANKSFKDLSEKQIMVQALEVAGKGFSVLQETASQLTLTKQNTVNKLKKIEPDIIFDEICKLRSYEIEKIVTVNHWKDKSSSLVQGTATGAFGIVGIPFNFALSTFLYFRAVQNIAMMYGYDIKEDPRELEIASSVTMTCLFPDSSRTDDIAGVLNKMVLMANLSGLRKSLGTLTYKQMAEKGGIELLYVQIRALAHKAAAKALEEAGKMGIENEILRKMLEKLGEYLSRDFGKKAVPVFGAIIGGLTDLYMMDRVLKGANIIYHKRFLMEKSIRMSHLSSQTKDQFKDILEYDEVLRR
jgi:hypothetical protein